MSRTGLTVRELATRLLTSIRTRTSLLAAVVALAMLAADSRTLVESLSAMQVEPLSRFALVESWTGTFSLSGSGSGSGPGLNVTWQVSQSANGSVVLDQVQPPHPSEVRTWRGSQTGSASVSDSWTQLGCTGRAQGSGSISSDLYPTLPQLAVMTDGTYLFVPGNLTVEAVLSFSGPCGGETQTHRIMWGPSGTRFLGPVPASGLVLAGSRQFRDVVPVFGLTPAEGAEIDWTFTWNLQPAGCTFSIAPTSRNHTASAGTGSITVTASASTCPWTATSTLPWVTITSGSGTGSGTATYAVAANTSTSPRTGTITVAGQTFTVNQDGATSSCTYSISPTNQSFGAAGGTSSVSVTPSGALCTWTAFADQPWLTVDPASGVGTRSVTLTSAANTSVAVRTATATIAGQAVSVTQAAGTPNFVVGPTAWNPSDAGGTQTVTVTTTSSDALWTASTSANWLTVSATGGIGSGAVTLTAAANSGGTRTATATIAGHTVSVVQGLTSPFDLRVTQVAGNLVTLRWSWSGPPTAGFVVAGGLQPGTTFATLPTGSASPIFTFTAPTGAFFVRVHAAEDSAFARPSNEVPLVVNLPVAPSSPVNLLGTVSGNRLDLAWTNTFGGGAATGVTLRVTGATTAALPLALTERFNFVGVPPGTYTFAVVATNAGGASAASAPLTLTFPSPCTGPPLPPNRFLAYHLGRTVFVVWETAETGPAPTDFILTVTELGLSLPTSGARALSGTVVPGSYTLAVSAINSCGASGPTPAQTVVVP